MGRYAGNKAVMQLIIIDEVSGSSKMMKIKIQGFAQCLSMMWTDLQASSRPTQRRATYFKY